MAARSAQKRRTAERKARQVEAFGKLKGAIRQSRRRHRVPLSFDDEMTLRLSFEQLSERSKRIVVESYGR